MESRLITTTSLALLLAAFSGGQAAAQAAPVVARDNGVVRVKSGYPVDETIARLKADIAAKGIPFFNEIDQSKLAADAGLDWPVRLLVTQDEHGDVWAVYTDFDWIARRHAIGNRAEQFRTATCVIGSITSAVRTQP